MATEFNINELFQQSFNRPLPTFQLPKADPVIRQAKKGQPFFEDDLYGREVFLPVNFYIPLTSGQIKFQVPLCVMSITQKKTIVETTLVERSGTVKELISKEDYVIDIKGIVVRPDYRWPEDEIQAIEQLYNYDQSIVIRSALSDIFLSGVHEHRVVVKSFNMPASAGTTHAKAFELNCVSDSIFDLELD